ncbi:MAG: hypothetical protein Q8S01_03035, partial [Ignavibacteria bacterium]|nr:hypothetical protein [Ignavibacteria bacterium]
IYLRHYRDITVYNSILEFLIPMYEQAKFEEQKNIPVLQIIDYGYLPEKKTFPPRLLFSAIATFSTLFIAILFLILREVLISTKNSKIIFIKDSFSNKK